ncbi:formate-dependent phosphoribosylglycinamide formyltransferase [Methanococcus maripaludis]|uniref:Formate-dependent phosphoribosylglycinamide formyltransferase n=2 Tax=Methanococcus maripaludis TaxID=39152 RepID=PURT_METM7|nr:formate-dependent phosphoribosylglycinamide formyltransferase [Methanococcus maripaludis]A6VIB2.1 RecName: Full=Formate-dependent phosphoribosylglycinamide formyltransferase; AltName: Full=5'-phosphoribosylglycinamide transformylase 2; AltName: Full=Formate-dependent GAR transformylase; AltName: Full=GAR transformylase 2; Short=GART 2; AltName: Full=Non-folate glycinamide ribonucleotide transformylase; AltName: Full=Phosphoribosylglycinamide formyltransferase 2 [Methanococcus maripaludis C7]MB
MVGTPLFSNAKKILLLGSGELGKEVIIEAQRFGVECIAVDSYENAPAMQVAHRFHVIDMKDGGALRAVIEREKPDLIVPEIEAINTDTLKELETEGYHVVPTANATKLTMDREGIRRLAFEKLGLRTAKYEFAESLEELKEAVQRIGIPCVIKPIMSSSGKGQSTIKSERDIEKSWDYAKSAARGIGTKVIVEEFIKFDYEITLLTARTSEGTKFCEPIGHIQIDGDYHESWQPHPMCAPTKAKAQEMAKKITDELGGYGIFGVELFVLDDEVIFSEVSPRPHDTGMVTMVTQKMSEFEIHARAILGLPVNVDILFPGASHVIKSEILKWAPEYEIHEASKVKDTKIRLFGKPIAKVGRRMGVALAVSDDITKARENAEKAAHLVNIK